MTREEAIDFLYSIARDLRLIYGEDYTSKDGTKMRDAIEILEQEPRKGHWIEGQTDNPKIHNILCSCCFEGYPSKGHANSQYTKKKFQYCPNCGAEMESKE